MTSSHLKEALMPESRQASTSRHELSHDCYDENGLRCGLHICGSTISPLRKPDDAWTCELPDGHAGRHREGKLEWEQ